MAAMKCARCGAEMNHHADKTVYSDSDPGGAIERLAEMHACPNCGFVDMRMAEG